MRGLLFDVRNLPSDWVNRPRATYKRVVPRDVLEGRTN
jgi:hypothetical protein